MFTAFFGLNCFFAPLLQIKRVVWLWIGMLGWIAGTSELHGGSISFGNDPGNILLQSQGVTALDDAFIFELGGFQTGFIPTVANLPAWQVNWKPFDRAQAPSSSGWNSAISYFNSGATLLPNGHSDQGLSSDVFTGGELAYLWVYNSKSIVPGSEWALVTNDDSDGIFTNNWQFSDPTDPLAFPVEFQLSTASNPIFGGLNNVQGGGDFTVPPTTFHLQTHVVPEPTGALLILIAGILVRLQRARSVR